MELSKCHENFWESKENAMNSTGNSIKFSESLAYMRKYWTNFWNVSDSKGIKRIKGKCLTTQRYQLSELKSDDISVTNRISSNIFHTICLQAFHMGLGKKWSLSYFDIHGIGDTIWYSDTPTHSINTSTWLSITSCHLPRGGKLEQNERNIFPSLDFLVEAKCSHLILFVLCLTHMKN